MYSCQDLILFLVCSMLRRPTISQPPDTLVPYTTLFRSALMLSDGVPFHALLSARPYAPAIYRISGRRVPRGPYVHRVHRDVSDGLLPPRRRPRRSEEHTSELPSLMRSSYAIFCLKKKNTN